MKLFQKKKKNQKGFTLVELIVTVAVLSVVLVMIFSMMTSGTTFFHKSNASIKTTYSLQEVLSQIKETMIDCNCTVMIGEAKDSGGYEFEDDNKESQFFVAVDRSGSPSAFTYTAHIYHYDSDAEKLFYGEYTFDTPTEAGLQTSVEAACTHVLAEGVKSFLVKPKNKKDTTNSIYYIDKIDVDVEIQKDEKIDTARETIAFRNVPRQVGYGEYSEIPVS